MIQKSKVAGKLIGKFIFDNQSNINRTYFSVRHMTLAAYLKWDKPESWIKQYEDIKGQDVTQIINKTHTLLSTSIFKGAISVGEAGADRVIKETYDAAEIAQTYIQTLKNQYNVK